MKKPCITLREETEWTELSELGANFLTGIDRTSVCEAFKHFQTAVLDWSARPYGNGDAGKKIARRLAEGF